MSPRSVTTESKIKIGIVGKPHGLSGAFFVADRQDSWPKNLVDVWILSPLKKPIALKISKVWRQQKRTVVQPESFSSRNDVDAVKGLTMVCRREDLAYDEDQEYLWADLVGKEVAASDGQILGKIMRVENFGASDIVYLENPEKGELALPFVASYFDMSFSGKDPCLQLLVSAETFAEAWETPRA